MTRTSLASLAFVLVATLGSTGCGQPRYYARYGRPYGYVPVRMRAVYVPMGVPVAPPAPPPPAEQPPPPPAEVAPPPEYPSGPRPIVIHANVPGTTIIVVNPPPGAPPVMQVAPPAPVAPQPAALPAPQQEEGWFDGE
jgi:hypothetical protein